MRGERLALLLPLLLGFGFRGDGTAVYADARPPDAWTPDAPVAWRHDTTMWGNASPVIAGALVCITEEPTTLICLDRATGRERWRATHPVVDALPAAQAAALRPRIEAVTAKLDGLPAAYAEQSKLRRALRRAPEDAALLARVEALTAEVFAVQAEAEALRDYLTPADKDQIGYATPTPVAQGDLLYASFGNGVVAAHRLDGTRAWIRWLGPPPTERDGYSYGVTTSPVLVDGVLVVGHDALVGLDPATGAERWSRPRWRAYGTPTVATVAGTHLLVTPDGEVLRPSDGAVLDRGLGEIWFVGPTARGDRVLFLGGKTGQALERDGQQAWMVQLSLSGGTVSHRELWRTRLPRDRRLYATALWQGDRIVAVDDDAYWTVVDAGTGARVHDGQLAGGGPGFYSAIVGDGTRAWVGGEHGRTFVIDPATGVVSGPHQSEGYRSTLVLDAGRAYLRTLSGLTAYGR